jgi:hypothetical protein
MTDRVDMDTKLEALRDLLSGRLRPDLDDPLRQELADPESPASQFLQGLRVAGEDNSPLAVPPVSEAGLFPAWASTQRRSVRTATFAAATLLPLLCMGAMAWVSYGQAQMARDQERLQAERAASLETKIEALAAELQSALRANVALERHLNSTEKLARAQAKRDPSLPLRLVQALADKSPEIRREAAVTLGVLGSSAEFALPAVRNRLAVEENGEVKQELNSAIIKIQQK